MSNKTQLQTNNTALDALITRVNAAKETAASLPEAGGGAGGDVKTCTVTFAMNDPFGFGGMFRWISLTDGIYSTEETGVCDGESYEVVCNSMANMPDATITQVSSVDGTSQHEGYGNIYIGTSDTTITFE
jgi:hypothetical protein